MSQLLKGLRDAANVTVVSNTTSKPVLYADYMSTSNIDFTMESLYARNKGVNSIRWDKDREGTLTTTMEVFEQKWLALLFGTGFATSDVDISKREVLPVVSQTATLATAPKTGSLVIFIKDGVGHGTEQTAGNPGTTVNTYSISGTTLTFNATTFADNAKEVVCYYLVNSSVSNFKVTVSGYPSGYKLYLDTALRDTEQNDGMVQICLPNVKPKSNVNLSMDADNVAVLTIEWDIMADSNGDMMIFSDLT